MKKLLLEKREGVVRKGKGKIKTNGKGKIRERRGGRQGSSENRKEETIKRKRERR